MKALIEALLELSRVCKELNESEIEIVQKVWGYADDFSVETFIGHAIDYYELSLADLAEGLNKA